MKNNHILFGIIIFFALALTGSAAVLNVGSGYTYATDGTADDVQINQAIQAAASGDTVYVHSGTYYITQPIVMKSGITLKGDGPGSTTLFIPTSALSTFNIPDESIITLNSVNHATIYGFKIDGNDGLDEPGGDGSNIHVGRAWENGIMMHDGGSDITIHDMYFTKINGDAIRTYAHSGPAYIYNVRVARSGHDAIRAQEVSDWHISNISVDIYNNYGIRFSEAEDCSVNYSTFTALVGSGNAAIGIDDSAPGLVIDHCRFHSIYGSTSRHGILATSGTGAVTVTNNVFWKCYDGGIRASNGLETFNISYNIFDTCAYATSNLAGATLTRNIISNSTSYAVSGKSSSTTTLTGNNIYGGATSVSGATVSGTLTGDPKYTNYGSKIFIPLQSSAPLYSYMSTWTSAGYGIINDISGTPTTPDREEKTPLTFNSKYVVQSEDTVTTSSSSLSNDTEAVQSFTLTSAKTVLIIYRANSKQSDTNSQTGTKNAIWIDGNDYSIMTDSPDGNNYSTRNFCFYVGELAAGTHYIAGRVASVSDGNTVTVSNRDLIIYVLNGDNFEYIDSSTAQSTVSTSFSNDGQAQLTAATDEASTALVLYGISNIAGTTENNAGKAAAISIGGTDYAEVKKSPNGNNMPDSLATFYVKDLSADTSIKGRYRSIVSAQTTVSRSTMAVLLFDPDYVDSDVVTNTSQVTVSGTSFSDDTPAVVTRTTGAELLVLAQATKNEGVSSSDYGQAYGISLDSTDVAHTRSSPAAAAYSESGTVAYATTTTTGAHTIKGRLASNYGSNNAIVNSRILSALWFTDTTAVNAAFSASPTAGNASTVITFTDSSTGYNIDSWAWDFDNDGVTDSTLQNPTYVYTTAGTYTVKLTVSNDYGTDTETKAGYITISAPQGEIDSLTWVINFIRAHWRW